MANKRHGGLGRGLDALIPRAPRSSQENAEGQNRKEQEKPGQEVREEIPGKAGQEVREEFLQREGQAVPEENPQTEGRTLPGQPGSGQESVEKPLQEQQEKTESMSGNVQMLRLSQVDPNRSQPRQNFQDEALEELAESIRQFGVLQPILVQKKGSRYEIIAGERRWRASRKAGLKEIPAIVREYSDQETVELSLIENIQREDLNPIEEAKAFKRLLDEFGLRQEDLAARVSKSRTAVANAVRLLKLDERVQNMIIQDQISMGHARALLPVEIPDEQFFLAQQAAEKQLSVREVEKLIKARLAAGKKPAGKLSAGKKDAEGDPALELAYRAIEERLRQSLGTKASIRHAGGGAGKLEIDFYSHEDLEKIVDLLT